MYLSLGQMGCLRLVSASLPNMTKKGDSFECWLGSQLYDASSHSLFLEMCFAKHDLRKLWKPSILLFDCSQYGGV